MRGLAISNDRIGSGPTSILGREAAMDDGQDLASIEREGRWRAFGALALIGASVALFSLSRLHDRQLAALQPTSRRPSTTFGVE